MLFARSVLRMFEQISSQSFLLSSQPFDLRPDIGQAISGMSVLHLSSSSIIQEIETRRDKIENRELRSGTPGAASATAWCGFRDSAGGVLGTALVRVCTIRAAHV